MNFTTGKTAFIRSHIGDVIDVKIQGIQQEIVWDTDISFFTGNKTHSIVKNKIVVSWLLNSQLFEEEFYIEDESEPEFFFDLYNVIKKEYL